MASWWDDVDRVLKGIEDVATGCRNLGCALIIVGAC